MTVVPGADPPTPSDETGLTLVELMVALLVLGIILTGLVSVTVGTLRITLINDQRSVATNLAQAEIERVRALSFEQLQAQLGDQPPQVIATEDGIDFELVRSAAWAAIDADTDPCAEPDGSTVTAVIRVDVTVRPVTQPDHAVTSTTTVARPPATPASGVGALNVRIFDQQQPAAGVPSVTVQLIGPEPSGEIRMQTTPDAGCVLFTDIPTGNYTVAIERLGYVSAQPGPDAAAPRVAAGVGDGQRTTVEFAYAPRGGLLIAGSDALLGTEPMLVPVDLPVTIARNDLVELGTAGVAFDPVWPGSWDVWAGDCRYADPRALTDADEPEPQWPGADRQPPVAAIAGIVTTGTAELGRVRLNPNVTGPGTGVEVTIAAVAVSPCATGTPNLMLPGQHPLTGTTDIGLPYGVWDVVVDEVGGPRSGTVRVTVDPRDPAQLTPELVLLS